MDRRAIGHPAWESAAKRSLGLVERGRTNAERLRRDSRTGCRRPPGRPTWPRPGRSLATHGRSLFRWFRSDYRRARRHAPRPAPVELPRTLADRSEARGRPDRGPGRPEVAGSRPDRRPARAGRLRRRAGRARSPTGTSLARDRRLGFRLPGARAPWDHRGILVAAGIDPTPCRRRSGRSSDEPETRRRVGCRNSPSSSRSTARTRSGSLRRTPCRSATWLARLRRWRRTSRVALEWIGYRMRRRRLEEAGLAAIVSAIARGADRRRRRRWTSSRSAYYQALIRDVFRNHRDLAEFDGRSYEQWIEEFRSLDQRRIEMARGEVATAHYDAIPRHAAGGEMAVLRREFEKKRKHKPIRQLIKEAGTAILAIKPVFMMSPISVAQFLEPGSVTFDLLLIDEASQVSPVDALGAMARAGAGGRRRGRQAAPADAILQQDARRRRDRGRRRRPQRRRPGEHPRALRRPGDVAADAPLALPQPPSFADRRLEPRVLRQPALRRPEPDDDHGDARAPLPTGQGRASSTGATRRPTASRPGRSPRR